MQQSKGPRRNFLGGPFLRSSDRQNTSTGSAPICKALPPERSDNPPASSKASSASRQSSPDATAQPLHPTSSAECRSQPCTCPCSSTDQAAPASGSQSCSTSQSSDVPSRNPDSPAGPPPERRCCCPSPRTCTCPPAA